MHSCSPETLNPSWLTGKTHLASNPRYQKPVKYRVNKADISANKRDLRSMTRGFVDGNVTSQPPTGVTSTSEWLYTDSWSVLHSTMEETVWVLVQLPHAF
jgi:hypothetical protein